MSFVPSRFVQAVLVLGIAFVVLRVGIHPPAPWSVLTLYMSIVLLAVLVFVAADSDSWRGVGTQPPPPWSVLTLYMSIVLLAVLVFVSADSDSWREFVRPIRSTLVNPDRRHLRIGLLIAVALRLGYYAHTQHAAQPTRPPEIRAVTPA